MSYEDDFNHLKIQLEDIMKATNNFCDKWIGKGGFGQVYKGELNLRDREGRSTVAFKRLDREFGQGDIEFWKEIVMLSKLRHENLVSLLHFCNEGDERILVYEYASRGSLDSHLGDPNLTWTRRLQICIGVARGLKYLHTPRETHDRVLHRDIKSANILLDEKWNAKLSDFGLSKISPANQSHSYLISAPLGTHGYCDPWYFKTNELTKESDVYSFGVVLFEVMCGRKCYGYHNGTQRILVEAWQKCYDEERLNDVIYDDSKEKIDKGSLKTFSTIANRCLNYKRVERPLMVEIIQELDIALQQQDSIDLLQGHYIVSVSRDMAPTIPKRGIEAIASLPFAVALITNGLLFTMVSLMRVQLLFCILWGGLTVAIAIFVRANGRVFCNRPRLHKPPR